MTSITELSFYLFVRTNLRVIKRNPTVILKTNVLSRTLHLKSPAKCVQIFLIMVLFGEIISLR